MSDKWRGARSAYLVTSGRGGSTPGHVERHVSERSVSVLIAFLFIYSTVVPQRPARWRFSRFISALNGRKQSSLHRTWLTQWLASLLSIREVASAIPWPSLKFFKFGTKLPLCDSSDKFVDQINPIIAIPVFGSCLCEGRRSSRILVFERTNPLYF